MVVEELVAILGFEFDDKELKSFNEGLKTATKSIAAVGAAALASATAVFAFTKRIAQINDELGKTSQTLGIATQELQGWILAAELGGSSQNELISSMENLSRRTSEAARGLGAGVEVFGLLGISATDANGNIKESSVILEEVADRVSQLGTQAEKLEFLEKLGISSGLLLTLDQGAEALRKQRLEVEQLGFALDENATKNAAEFNDELLRVTKIAGGVTNAVGQGIMPEIVGMLKVFKEWFIVNRDLIRQNITSFLTGLINVLRIAFNIISRVVNVINLLVQSIGGWTNAIALAGTAMLAFNAKAFLIPLLIGAIATAVFLLLEDIVTFFNGGESALGSFLEDFPKLEEAIRKVGSALAGLVNPATFLKTIDDFLKSVTNTVTDLLSLFGIKTTLFGATTIGKGTTPASNVNIPLPPQRPAFATTNNSVRANNNVTANITVNGANANPKEIATNIRKEISTVMSEVFTQTNKDVTNPIKR